MRPLLVAWFVAVAGHLSGVESQEPQSPAPPAPGVITGIVRDDLGRPVVGAVVQAIGRRKRWAGPYYETQVGRPDESDDRGQFRLHSLPPGAYVVAVSLKPTQPQQQQPAYFPSDALEYVRTYNPSATALEDAQPITVQAGAEQSVTVRLARVRFVSVSGFARTSAGQPAVNFRVWVRGGPTTVNYMGTQGGFITTRVGGTQVDKNGYFSLSRVPAGSYVLTFTNGNSRQAQNDPSEIAEIPLEVREKPVTDLTVVTAPAPTVSGHLEWRGTGPAPWLRVSGPARIRATGLGYDSDTAAMETEIQPEGTFRFTNVHGLRRIVALSLSFNLTISAVEGPKDLISGRSIDIKPSRDITDLTLIVNERPGSLMATVSDEADKPYSGWVVLMSRTPDDLDAMGWGFGATQSNYGTAGVGYYRLDRLTPGTYLVAAIDIEPHRLRDDSELMERARAGAVPVDIREGQQTQLNVRLVRLRPFVQTP